MRLKFGVLLIAVFAFLAFPPSLAAEAAEAGNAACPISGDKVSPKVSYEYKGKTYHFCCAGCINKFKKDPEKYIADLGKEKTSEASHHHGG